MLSFTSSLSSDSEALVIFVNEKYGYKDRRGILSKDISQKVNAYLANLKGKKEEEELSLFDISNKKKCFIIKVKSKYENNSPQEKGGSFFANLKHYKKINKVDIYLDSLDFDSAKLVSFFSKFVFGLNLKSYTFNKYKTLNKEKINKKVSFKIVNTVANRKQMGISFVKTLERVKKEYKK